MKKILPCFMSFTTLKPQNPRIYSANISGPQLMKYYFLYLVKLSLRQKPKSMAELTSSIKNMTPEK